MSAEPRNIGTLIGRDPCLGISGAAHISAAEVFRGITNIQAAIGMTKVLPIEQSDESMTDSSETLGRFRFDPSRWQPDPSRLHYSKDNNSGSSSYAIAHQPPSSSLS